MSKSKKFTFISFLIVFLLSIIFLNFFNLLDPIVADFQVNDNQGQNGPGQVYPAIAKNSTGQGIAVWVDGRNGFSDLYAQRLMPDGTPLGANIRLTHDQTYVRRRNPAVALSSTGHFIVTWEAMPDDYYSYISIFAQQFNDLGIPQNNEFQVSGDSTLQAEIPDIDCDPQGNYVITWSCLYEDKICARLYASTGIALGPPFYVSDDSVADYQQYPAVSMDTNGNFIIVCRNWANGSNNVWAQRYTAGGTKIGQPFIVNTSPILSRTFPNICHDENGNFIITWKTDSLIYAQRYSAYGIKLGSNFQVNTRKANPERLFKPGIAIDKSDHFMVVWESLTENYQTGITGQIFTSNGIPSGSNFKINSDSGFNEHQLPATASDSSGNFTVIWQDDRLKDFDIFVQEYNSSGLPVGDNRILNTDTLSNANQNHSSLMVTEDENFTIIWQDERNGNREPAIYGQFLNSNGSPINNNFRISQDHDNSNEYCPEIAHNQNGNFVVAWVERNSYISENFMIRCFSAEGIPITSNIRVNEDSLRFEEMESPLAVAMDNGGNFVVTWGANSTPPPVSRKIYIQRYSHNGQPLGINRLVSEDSLNMPQLSPDIAMDPEGNFMITWTEFRNSSLQIFLQRYAADGSKIGTNVIISQDSTSLLNFSPAISMGNEKRVLICWFKQHPDSNLFTVNAQFLDQQGNKLGSNFQVSQGKFKTTGFTYLRRPALSADKNDNFIVCWNGGMSTDQEIYAQRFDSSGRAIGRNFLITVDTISYKRCPDVYLLNNRIYSCWEDKRIISSLWDIWANVLDFDNPVSGIEKNMSGIIPDRFRLLQNFPNPFNPSTCIEYSIPLTCQVNLSIFNLLGQKIKTLVRTRQSPGKYRIIWDGTNEEGHRIATGVYVYKLETDHFTRSRKMLLIR